MAGTKTLRIPEPTSARLSHLAEVLREPCDRVLERALDAIEREIFWEGWNEEAAAYLEHHGEQEAAERAVFAGTLADGGTP